MLTAKESRDAASHQRSIRAAAGVTFGSYDREFDAPRLPRNRADSDTKPSENQPETETGQDTEED